MRAGILLTISVLAALLAAGLAATQPAAAAPARSAATGMTSTSGVLRPWPVTITIRTVPSLGGVRFLFDGQPLTTNPRGYAAITERHNFSAHTLQLAEPRIATSTRRYAFFRWAGQRDPNQAFSTTVRGLPMRANYTITAGFGASCLVSPRLAEQNGAALRPARVSKLTVRSDLGQPANLSPSGASWLPCAWPVYQGSQLSIRNLQYSVQTMLVSGTNAVHAGLERFEPISQPYPTLTGYFYALTVTAHDAFFGSAMGSYALLTMPDHSVRKVVFGTAHTATLRDLPIGTYRVLVKSGSASIASQAVRLSRNETADLTAVSTADVAAMVAALVAGVAGLPLLSRSRRSRVAALARRGAQVLRGAV